MGGMEQVLAWEAAEAEQDREAQSAQARAPEGWRVVWLPQHQLFLAYRDVDMPAGLERPAMTAATADETLVAVRRHQQLADAVREWIYQHKHEESRDDIDATS